MEKELEYEKVGAVSEDFYDMAFNNVFMEYEGDLDGHSKICYKDAQEVRVLSKRIFGENSVAFRKIDEVIIRFYESTRVEPDSVVDSILNFIIKDPNASKNHKNYLSIKVIQMLRV